MTGSRTKGRLSKCSVTLPPNTCGGRSAGLERLLLVVGMPGAVRARELRIELAVRGAQPSLPEGRMRIERALEYDLPALRVEDAQHDEKIGVAGRRRHEKLERRRAGDLRLALQRRRREGDPFPHGIVGD